MKIKNKLQYYWVSMNLSIWAFFICFGLSRPLLSDMDCPLLATKIVQLDKPIGALDGPFDSSTSNEHLIGDENGCDIKFS